LIVLAVDTALGACQAAVLDGGRPLAIRSEPMQRGHQERLAPLVQEVMAEAGLGFAALHRIGVTLGPGSFTGVRVGLAFAKGLALALGIPLAGVGSLEALAASAPQGEPVSAVIDAKREQVYLQSFHDVADGPPEALALDEARERLHALGPHRLLGPGASLFGDLEGMSIESLPAPDPAVVARLAAAAAEPSAPRPLYLRAPDARLPA
jgi:tRNA threonylcarbamoyladenosine biosynthesis protein TsaB